MNTLKEIEKMGILKTQQKKGCMTMSVLSVNKENFEQVTNTEKKVLLDFFATWCGPCQLLSPVLEQLEKEIDNLKIIKVNVDEHNELARKHGIMSIPTLEIYKNNKLVKMHIGYIDKDELKQILN